MQGARHLYVRISTIVCKFKAELYKILRLQLQHNVSFIIVTGQLGNYLTGAEITYIWGGVYEDVCLSHKSNE